MKALPEKILDIIQQLPEGEVLTPSRFLHHGSRHAVQRGLSRLVEGGKLFRVARGIYVAAVETRFGVRPPAPEKVVHSLANALGEVLVDHGARAANKLGLSTQVPVRYVFLTTGRSRKLQVGKTTVSIRHAPRWLMALGATGAGDAIRVLDWLGEASVGDAVSKLHKLLPENEWGGSSVSSPLVAYLDGECNLRSVELHLHPPCQVGLAVSCSLLTARPASSGMGQFDVKAREASG